MIFLWKTVENVDSLLYDIAMDEEIQENLEKKIDELNEKLDWLIKFISSIQPMVEKIEKNPFVRNRIKLK